MKLKRVSISLDEWGACKGRYIGEITFAGGMGEFKINVGPELSDRVLEICAEEIINAGREAALKMTRAVIESQKTPAIEQQD